jgi:hypothetical protein
MPAARVAVRPVHDAAFVVPDIIAVNAQRIADAKRHARRQVKVVRDQHGRAIRQLHQPSLVFGAFAIVRQHFQNRSRESYTDIAQPIFLGGQNFLIVRRNNCTRRTHSRLLHGRGRLPAGLQGQADQHGGGSRQQFPFHQIHPQDMCRPAKCISESGNRLIPQVF